MTTQGKVNYDAYAKQASRADCWTDLSTMEQAAFEVGADAVEAYLASLPADEDMPGNEPGPAQPKIVIVTDYDQHERRHLADGYSVTDSGILELTRDGVMVALYPGGGWKGCRVDESTPAADAAPEPVGPWETIAVGRTPEDGQ